jgi:hypothetical protein
MSIFVGVPSSGSCFRSLSGSQVSLCFSVTPLEWVRTADLLMHAAA